MVWSVQAAPRAASSSVADWVSFCVSATADSEDDEMDTGGGELSGGLIDFVNAVMAGLVGSSPHMQVCGGKLQSSACWVKSTVCLCSLGVCQCC